jgi:hypothetical protein
LPVSQFEEQDPAGQDQYGKEKEKDQDDFHSSPPMTLIQNPGFPIDLHCSAI